jgi:hypothetical protein
MILLVKQKTANAAKVVNNKLASKRFKEKISGTNTKLFLIH